nr:hypothetical protein [Tanacetum cinerariifolium]GEX11539.1 hypothetical protein [Tanacetum cinerariifolium]
MDYKRTKENLPKVRRSRQMDEDLRESYHTLEKRLFHKGRIVTPSFIAENNMLPSFKAIGRDSFLTLNEPICPRFVVKFYHSLEVKRNEEEHPYIEFKLDQFTFEFTFHECVMDPLEISRYLSKEKGKRVAFPSVISSSSSSSNDNEAPSFLEFYDELSDNEDLLKPNERTEECLNA